MSYRILICLLIFGAASAGCKKISPTYDRSHQTGIKRVWAIDDGEKIKMDDLDNFLATDENNAVWKDSTLNLFGARNEIIAFQLIIQAEPHGASDVNVLISNLRNGSSVIPGSNIGSNDPFDYRGRNIELFTEHYFNITKRTPSNWWHYSGSARPSEYYTGWIPDCLVPFQAVTGKGGAPFSIPGSSNQAVWIDILIPKNAVSGIFSGNATISISGKTYCSLPIKLKVYNFTLPDSTHINSMFGLYPEEIARRHGVNTGSAAYYQVETKYHQMAHRHRFDIVRFVPDLEEMNNYHRKYLNGEMYNPSNGYEGPGQDIGNTTFSIGYGGDIPQEYGGDINAMNRQDWWSGSDAWADWFITNAPGVRIHKYLFPDEPEWKGPSGALGTGSMDTIRMQAEWTHSDPGTGNSIPSLVTNKIREDLKGYVDFWSVSAQEAVESTNPADVASEKALGHKFGVYNGWRPGMGAIVTDADGVEFRVMPWIVWKYSIDQYFYWCINYWTDGNVFADPLTYANAVNGDGTFFYPGEDHIFLTENRGLAGPMASIRAKNWRRGAQDYEYLWLAHQSGLDNEIKTIVDACVPTAMWDAKSQANISWSSRGYVFEQYRKQLADLLESTHSKH